MSPGPLRRHTLMEPKERLVGDTLEQEGQGRGAQKRAKQVECLFSFKESKDDQNLG